MRCGGRSCRARIGAAYRALVGGCGRLRPDVVHTHSSKAGIIGRWAARSGRRVPVVVTPFTGWRSPHRLADASTASIAAGAMDRADHRPDRLRRRCDARPIARGRHRQARAIRHRLQRHGDRAVSASAGAARDGARSAGAARRSTWPSAPSPGCFISRGTRICSTWRRNLCRRFPQLRFLWVGDGLLRPAVRSADRADGLTDRFILTGLVPPGQIPELANAMDILVHPSRREGLARACRRGSSAGCRCVTYDIDGAKEGLIDGVSGFLLPAFDREKLGDSLARLLDDAPLRARMGEAGRAFALGRFDDRVMVSALEAVYRQAGASRITSEAVGA